jgi:hypothetical protein
LRIAWSSDRVGGPACLFSRENAQKTQKNVEGNELAHGGCAIGGGRHVSELCQMYESSPEFRAFITEKMRDGSLAKSNVVALSSIARTGEPSPLQKDADALLETFFSR